MNKIEELENKALALVQEIAELKKTQNAGEWEPKDGETYYFMSHSGNVSSNRWEGDCVDIGYSKYTLLFKTQKECQKYIDYRKALIEKSYKFSETEWNGTSFDKYTIRCHRDHWNNPFIVESFRNVQYINAVYFKTREDAQFMIDNYSDEMLKWGLL